MIPILPDERLAASRDDLALVLSDGVLRAPPDVVALLHRLGVRDASLVLAAFDEMPTAFMAAFDIAAGDLPRLRECIARSLRDVAPDGNDPNFRAPPRGAFRPR